MADSVMTVKELRQYLSKVKNQNAAVVFVEQRPDTGVLYSIDESSDGEYVTLDVPVIRMED